MPKRKALEMLEAKGSKYEEGRCKECRSTNVISSSGDEYCGDCGAVLESVILTTSYSYEAEHGNEGITYVRMPTHVNTDDPASVRLHNKWSRGMIRQATEQLTGACRQLGLPSGVEQRAKYLFVESTKRLMESGCEWVFGRRTGVRVAACVYIAGLESGRPVTLVDVAGAAQTSVYAIGHETKQTLTMLELKLPLLDPLLRVEQAVNRVFGGVLKSEADSQRTEIADQVSGNAKGARTFALRLVDFVADGEQRRTQAIEVAGQVLAFDQLCSRATGTNPNTLVCSAVAMSLEHLYVCAAHTEEDMLRRSQREVIFRLVTLFNGAGQHTVLRHVTATQKALIEAGKTAPWLTGIKLTIDTVAVHLEGILFCYEQARALLFAIHEKQNPEASSLEGFEASVSGVVANLSKAPSFVRSEMRRERRARILENAGGSKSVSAAGGDGLQREIEVIGRLHRAGAVDREALLSMPLHTLEQLGNMCSRGAMLDEEDRRRLDSETVGLDDMDDDEALAYIGKSGIQ
ncbi:transcription factor TFIIIB subunit brf1 [Coemansia sp. RSA 1933]|nr:transcription factor TFIIIB subunit brf1 [Coemansia sp. RSA 1933]